MVFKGIVLRCIPPASLLLHPIDSAAVVKVDLKEDVGSNRFDLRFSLVTVYNEVWDAGKKCFVGASYTLDEVCVESMLSEDDDAEAIQQQSKKQRTQDICPDRQILQEQPCLPAHHVGDLL